MQAFLDRATQLKQRGALQLEGVQYAVGDFRISLARAVQVGAALGGLLGVPEAAPPCFLGRRPSSGRCRRCKNSACAPASCMCRFWTWVRGRQSPTTVTPA